MTRTFFSSTWGGLKAQMPALLTSGEVDAIVNDLGLICLCYAQSCGFRKGQVLQRSFWQRNRYVRMYVSLLTSKTITGQSQRQYRNTLRTVVDLVIAKLQQSYVYNRALVGRPALDIIYEHRAKMILTS